ncbi:MAG TPA: type II toxin-antitoxin system HicA family toxin [Dongiaceae bacterium]|nr:type II toxin-antitoxin system HicA family toxin [Dongiaceae bacterium]
MALNGVGSGPLPRVDGRATLRALLRGGFELSHVRGSHHYLRGPGGRLVPIPVHGSETLPPGTLRSVLRLAGISVKRFAQLLDE